MKKIGFRGLLCPSLSKYTCYFWGLVMVLFIGSTEARAQEDGGLGIGAMVPPLLLNHILDHPTATLNLAEFRGKLLLLDFWEPYCVPCLKMMPVMDSLQRQFKGRLAFLSVTEQPQDSIAHFLRTFNSRHGLKPNIPCAAQDSTLGVLFPSRFVPHYVWIDGGGKVIAITADDDVTPRNIAAALDSGHLAGWTPKHDIDVNKPLYAGPWFPDRQLVNYRILIRGHLEGTGAGAHRRSDGRSVGLAWTNIPLGTMYLNCGRRLIPNFSEKNLVLDIRDSSDFLQDHFKGDRLAWFHHHEYSLDVIVPVAEKDSLNSLLLQEVNTNGRYTAVVRTGVRQVLELRVLNGSVKMLAGPGEPSFLKSGTGGVQFRSQPVVNLISWLNEHCPDLPIMVDRTGLHAPVSVSLSGDHPNLALLQRELAAQGLCLQTSTGKVHLLYINELIEQP
jgi:thiol-disulfide isomerase/thioredoxin